MDSEWIEINLHLHQRIKWLPFEEPRLPAEFRINCFQGFAVELAVRMREERAAQYLTTFWYLPFNIPPPPLFYKSNWDPLKKPQLLQWNLQRTDHTNPFKGVSKENLSPIKLNKNTFMLLNPSIFPNHAKYFPWFSCESQYRSGTFWNFQGIQLVSVTWLVLRSRVKEGHLNK